MERTKVSIEKCGLSTFVFSYGLNKICLATTESVFYALTSVGAFLFAKEKTIVEMKDDFNLEAIDYAIKLQDLQQTPNKRQKFLPRQIAISAFNAELAVEKLTEEEQDLVFGLYDFYAGSETTLKLNLAEWQEMMNEIMSSIDMLAPFYKISSFDIGTNAELEELKKPFRAKAKNIVFNNEFITNKWTDLLKEFQEKFGKYL